MIKKQNQVFFSTLVIFDALLLILAWVAAFEIRFHVHLFPLMYGVPDLTGYFFILPVILILFPFAASLSGLYTPFGKRRLYYDIYFAAKTMGFLIVFILFAFFFIRAFSYSRVVVVYFWFFGTCFLTFSHMVSWRLLIKLRGKGEYLKKTLIVGAGELGLSLADKIDFHPEIGFLVSGFITVDPEKSGLKTVEGYRVLGGLEDLNRAIHRHDINQVFIALPAKLYGKIDEAIEILSGEMVDIKVIPDFKQYMRLNAGIEEFEGIPIINLVLSPMFGWNRVVKRAFDIGFTLLLALFIAPFMLLMALAVMLTSHGPAFYSQERMGLDGRRFMMYKFRSMYTDAEMKSGPKFSTKGDKRVTPVGKIMRRLSLDELPQLLNVLKGEMSLVGPRPERPMFVEEFRKKIPRYMQRHKMKAGMTGWAQVNDWRGNTSIDKRIEYDLYYIEHWSLFFDIKILIHTIWRVFFSKHAY